MKYNNCFTSYSMMSKDEKNKVEEAVMMFKNKLIRMINENEIEYIYDIRFEAQILPLKKITN